MSRQFDVFNHPSAARRDRYPRVIVLQHDGVANTGNVIVAPLVAPLSALRSRAYPILQVLNSPMMMLTPDLAGIGKRHLKRPVANLADQRDRIIAAIDTLFAGS